MTSSLNYRGSGIAAVRNADLRAAVKAAFPGTKIGVRNGPDGTAAISWTDGPTTTQVSAVVNTVKTAEGRTWAVTKKRKVSPVLVAVGFLRAHAAGKQFFTEHDTCPREHDTYARHGTTWSVLDDTVDERTITDAERLTASTLIALAGVSHDTQTTYRELSWQCWELAHTLFHHADVLHAALS